MPRKYVQQHIRRELAMRHIVTNEPLMPVTSAAYVAVLGPGGLRKVALENIRRAKQLAQRIDPFESFEAPLFPGAHFNEFVVRSEVPYHRVHKALLAAGVHGGLSLTAHFPELGEAALFATTEVHTEADYERLLEAMEAIR